MDAKKLEILIKAIDMGSFSKAAESVGYTQSGITHLVNSLEKEIGFRLVNRTFNGISLTKEGEILLHRLDLMGALISTGSACDSVNTQVSHVINAINVPVDYQKGTIRISFGKYNSIEDAASIGYLLRKIILGH